MRTSSGEAKDRKRTYKGPHRQKVQFYQRNSHVQDMIDKNFPDIIFIIFLH